MVSINKDLLAQRFSKASDLYGNATPTQEKMAQNLFKQILRRLSNKKITSILELGCGTGRLTSKLVNEFPQAKITAIDIAPEMISYAKKICPTVNYITADAEKHINLLEEKFDLIVSSATIQWFENPKQTLVQTQNLLKEDGLVAIATFADRTFCELSESFVQSYLKNNLEPRSHTVQMLPITDWKNIFTKVEVSEEIIPKYFSDVRMFLKSIQNAGAVNSKENKAIIPKRVLSDMTKYYAENFSNQAGEIYATYHVCYIFHNS